MFEDFRLRIFTTVASCGSFTKAAGELGITQPAVSQNISELEKIIGEPLFVRSRGDVSLTERGRILLDYAGKILFWYSKINSVLIQKTEDKAGPCLLKLSDSNSVELSVENGDVILHLLPTQDTRK